MECLENGTLEIEDITIDAANELIAKYSFSRDGDHWEATSTPDGSLVVAIDTTQDEAILTAGRARELMNHIQQLRKGAGLDISDVVEVFFEEGVDVDSTERAVAMNLPLFLAKFKGTAVPVPKRCAPPGIVVLRSDTVDVGGSNVVVYVCRPSLAGSDDLDELAVNYLSTLEPNSVGVEVVFGIDGKSYSLKKGTDYWENAAAKAKATKSVEWL
jgi:isoleucyl-tRNA synthetase